MKSDEQKATMKESPKRYTNPFLSDEENDKANFWNSQELNHSIVEDDLITNLEVGKYEESLPPCNIPSESLEKAKELFIDKKVTECQLPESIACYEESGFHVVKDICVDEGLSHGEKIDINKEHNKLPCNPIDGDKHDDMIEDVLATQLVSSPSEDCDTTADLFSVTEEKLDPDFPILKHSNRHTNLEPDHDDMIGGNLDAHLKHEKTRSSDEDHHTNSDSSFGIKEKTDSNLFSPVSTEKCRIGKENLDSSSDSPNNSATDQLVSDSTLSLSQDQPLAPVKVLEPSDNGVDQRLSEAQSPVDDILKRPLSGSEAERDRSSQTINNENINSNFDNAKPTTISSPHGTDDPECIHELPPPNRQDVAADNNTEANKVERGGGESSFSMAGPVSGLITYSGPIASAGSMSIRSDSSNTSVRSFAFPILQTEWNSSPVRMAKVDSRRSRKHQGWKQALLCCKF